MIERLMWIKGVLHYAERYTNPATGQEWLEWEPVASEDEPPAPPCLKDPEAAAKLAEAVCLFVDGKVWEESGRSAWERLTGDPRPHAYALASLAKKSLGLACAALLLCATPALAESPQRSSTLRQTDIVRDAHDNRVGSRECNASDCILRDKNGFREGTSRIEQGRTAIRDKNGFKAGTIGR
jgi:hypothetical protein